MEGVLLLRFLSVLVIAILMLTGCNGSATDAPPPDPHQLLQDAIKNIRASQTFRMLLNQTGADYRFYVNIDQSGKSVQAVMRRAQAQFVAPDVLYATINLSLSGLPLAVEIFARGEKQWFRLPSGPWLNITFAQDFNPVTLLSTDSGFQQALSSLNDVKYIGAETLDDGTPVYHISGSASGQSVKDLLVGLVDNGHDVNVDAYIAQSTRLPALVVITQPNTATQQQPQDTAWRVEVYDYNAKPDIQDPEAKQP
jgi:hypothetical protein